MIPLNLGSFGSLLGLVTQVIGTQSSPECFTLADGIAVLEAAVCLCSALKANKLVVKLKVCLFLSGCSSLAAERRSARPQSNGVVEKKWEEDKFIKGILVKL